MDEYPAYNLEILLPLASQTLRERGLEDTALNRYRILPTIRKNQLRSRHHERTKDGHSQTHGDDRSE